MNSRYQNQTNNYRNRNVNISEFQNLTGTIRLHVIDQISRESLPNPTITIYATDEQQRDVPVVHVMSALNPIGILLPVTCPFGTPITGPEYDFSTYNVRIDAFGYFANVIYNVRLFPNTAVDFRVEMVPITQVRLTPVIEERIEIPPHPRDVLPQLNNQHVRSSR